MCAWRDACNSGGVRRQGKREWESCLEQKEDSPQAVRSASMIWEVVLLPSRFYFCITPDRIFFPHHFLCPPFFFYALSQRDCVRVDISGVVDSDKFVFYFSIFIFTVAKVIRLSFWGAVHGSLPPCPSPRRTLRGPSYCCFSGHILTVSVLRASCTLRIFPPNALWSCSGHDVINSTSNGQSRSHRIAAGHRVALRTALFAIRLTTLRAHPVIRLQLQSFLPFPFFFFLVAVCAFNYCIPLAALSKRNHRNR